MARPNRFADALTVQLRSRGLTYETAAPALGLSYNVISKWAGAQTMPKPGHRELARALQVIGWSEERYLEEWTAFNYGRPEAKPREVSPNERFTQKEFRELVVSLATGLASRHSAVSATKIREELDRVLRPDEGEQEEPPQTQAG